MNDFDIEFKTIQEDYYSQPIDDLLSRISDKKGSAVIFGSGAVGCSVAGSLISLGGQIIAFCDNYKTGMNEIFNLPIISPKQLLQQYKDAIVIVAVDYKHNDEIHNQLLGMGFRRENIYRRFFELYDIDKMKQHYEGYKWAYNFFDDDVSKKLLLDRIRMYLTGVELNRTSSAPQYFEPKIISLEENEVFVDGGAWIGDTADEFIRHTKLGKARGYRHIYSFEPDNVAREKATHLLDNYTNVDVIGKGLWSCDTELKFFSDGGNAGSSFVIGNCSISIPVTSLDSFLAGKPNHDLPTFIKLDIEGAEKEALIGARNIIRKKHPKLAVCVYHKPEDIYELPKLIYEMDQSYKFTLEQYADGIYETVLYAV